MLTSLSKNAVYRILCTVLLFLVLIGLPLTSFPLLCQVTGAIVAPFSAIPLAVLMLVWLVPFLLERGKFPAEIVPYLYFVLIAVIISALAFFLNGFYARGRDFFGQSLRAFITLVIGLSFYLTFAAFPRDEKTVRKIFLFIYIGGSLLILWTLLEVVLLRVYGNAQTLPGWMLSIRSILAVQSPTVQYTNRVTGFAYEPSWFVREFNLVLFPILLSAVVQRKSIFKFHIWKIQIEDLLMLFGLVVFGFSSPRVGLLAFLASVAYLGYLLIKGLHQRITKWYLKRRRKQHARVFWVKSILLVLIVVILLTVFAGALIGYILIASRWDNRYQLLFEDYTFSTSDIFPLAETNLILFARNLAFFERMIYWFSGWNIFNDFPFGVGLGNAGFYFNERMNGMGYDSLEIRNLVYRAGYLANTKNLWTRLLSETGFIGLAAFLVWLYILWRSTVLIRKSESKIMQILGLAGQLFLLAYLIEGLSMDSFAMPYQWVMTGLISAGGLIVRRELVSKGKPQVLESPQVS